jgi:hypothetical protein
MGKKMAYTETNCIKSGKDDNKNQGVENKFMTSRQNAAQCFSKTFKYIF